MTAIGLPKLSAFTPPSDPGALAAWLDERIVALQASIEGRLQSLLREHANRYLDANRPMVVTADASGEEIAVDWAKYTSVEVGPALGGIYTAGALTAWVGANDAGALDIPVKGYGKLAANWSSVVHEQAIDYMVYANNRVVGLADDMWLKVRDSIAEGLMDGKATEAIKAEVETLTGFTEFRADTIARTEVVGAYANGDRAGAVALGDHGPVEHYWMATGGPRTRESHAEADGQTVGFDEPFIVGGEALMFPHDPGGSPENVVNCRCLAADLYPGDTRPDGSTVPEPEPTQAEVVDDFVEPGPVTPEDDTFPSGHDAASPFADEIPAQPEILSWIEANGPRPYEAVYGGPELSLAEHQPQLSGGHAKMVLEDANGNRFLFKPMDEHLAHLESGLSEISRLGGIDTPSVHVHEFNGRVGSLQELLPGAKDAFNKSVFDPAMLDLEDLRIAREHRAFDWLVGNHDDHAGQFLRTGEGRLVGIDKAQAFKYSGADMSGDTLNFNYHPNSKYGEKPPVHNLIEDAFRKGKLSESQARLMYSDSTFTSPALQKARSLANITDSKYRELLRPYAEGQFGPTSRYAYRSDAAVQQFLDSAVARKNGLPGVIEHYETVQKNALGRLVKKQVGPAIKKAEGFIDPLLGAPRGMAGAIPSQSDLTFMDEHDSPLRDRTGNASSVRTYSGNKYSAINRAARNGENTPTIRRINAALGATKSDIEVYRGASMASKLPTDMGELQGKVMLDRAFLSTSAGADRGPAFGGDTLLRIKVNEGSKGSYIANVSQHPGEREFLIGNNQHLFVHTVREADPAVSWEARYKFVIEAETVSSEWAATYSEVWDTNNRRWMTANP